MNKMILLGLVLACCFFQKNNLTAQCSPDIEPPTVVVNWTMSVVLQNEEVEIWAEDFDLNSFDNCPGDLLFSFSADTTFKSQVFDCSGLGEHPLEVWVTDAAGNQDFFNVTFVLLGNPNSFLTCNAISMVTLPPGESVTFFPEDILASPPFCLPADWSLQLDFLPPAGPSPTIVFDDSDVGTHVVQVGTYDAGGNQMDACWGEVGVVECGSNDPPVATCKETVTITVDPGETVTIGAIFFDDGSSDDCTPPVFLNFAVENGAPPSAEPPSDVSLTFDESDVGTHEVVLWVEDTNDNWSNCVAELVVMIPDCDNDIVLPTPYCKNDLIVELMSGASEVEIWATDIDNNSFDDCTVPPDLEFRLEATSTPSANPPATESLVFEEGLHAAVMWVGDESGNWDYCETTIEISPCVGTTNLVCNNLVFISLPPGDGADFVPDMILEGGPYCDDNGNYFALQLDPPSTPLPSIPLTVADVGEHVVSIGLYDADDNLINECWGNIVVWAWSAVSGKVFLDSLDDCSLDNEPGFAGVPVQGVGQVTGNVYSTTTDWDGNYYLQTELEDTLVAVSLPLGYNYGGACGTTYTVAFPAGNSALEILDIPFQLNAQCPLLSVDIGTNNLRRCFDNTYYVNYCNLSTEVIDEISVEVTLDEYMDMVSTSIPGTEIGDDLWSFDIGTLQPGDCGTFNFVVNLSCEAPLSITHCVEAHIMPDTICPQGGTFTGANIEVDGFCENDSVYLNITNTGTAAMLVPLEYIVVEDVIMLQGGPFDLGPGESMPLAPIFASASTYRLEAPQEADHPYGGVAAVAIEGCGEEFTPGLVNMFPMNIPNPFISIDCRENTGAFDPNDKQAFPRGYGDEHFIEKNTDIEYLIRFQNTGTDTAFNVYILDTLSQFLDAASIRPGASSHAYQFELLEGNIVRFSFPDIMLPDSNVNEALSHGFVKFKASQMPNLDVNTVIENTAAIYFDFNEPVITNTVFHTIGEHFIEVVNSTSEVPDGFGELHVYPNPAIGAATFGLPSDGGEKAIFQLHDQFGRLVKMEEFIGMKYRFEREGLAAGIYFYSIDIEGVGKYTGKVVLK